MLLGNRALLVLTSGRRGLVRLLELWQALVLPLGRPLVAQMLAGQDVAPLVESVIDGLQRSDPKSREGCRICKSVRPISREACQRIANRPDPNVVRDVTRLANRLDPDVVRDVSNIANQPHPNVARNVQEDAAAIMVPHDAILTFGLRGHFRHDATFDTTSPR